MLSKDYKPIIVNVLHIYVVVFPLCASDLTAQAQSLFSIIDKKYYDESSIEL